MNDTTPKRIWAWSRWPWITTVVAVALAVSPVGQAFVAGAFSNEALSRNIARPILVSALVAIVVCLLLEAWIWRIVARRKP